MENVENPLLKALPPETDYISYLTILEYNLTKDQLPTLHNILQDTTLTANIGWDLVHLLLPLLPESQECLQDVAKLGNPREVVLKVTELLEGVANGTGEEEQDQAPDEENDARDGRTEDGNEDGHASSEGVIAIATEQESGPPSRHLRFSTMLDMLTILHSRIRTKYPSRFLSTSLQSILSAYTQLDGNVATTESVLGFVKQLSGTKRPALPPRKSSSLVPTQSSGHSHGSVPDPEGNNDGIAPGEAEMQRRLLQSFLTYVAEIYMSFPVDQEDDAPGMCWSARYQETLHPEKGVPGRQTLSELYAESEQHHDKDTIMGQILALARDLGLKAEDLTTVLVTTWGDSSAGDGGEADDPPSSPSDVPLSRPGALFILCTMAVSPILFQTSRSPEELASHLPDYTVIINNLISSPSLGTNGAENETFLDALFFLGFYILHDRSTISPVDDEGFNTALQRLSFLSAKLPSPTLRYHAHQLTSTILHLHPSENVRLAYIRDTLEHCPYDSLKGSAVGWLKDEFLVANTTKKSNPTASSHVSIFTTPVVLETLAPFLWPEIQQSSHDEAAYDAFQNPQVFYLALLNLLYLLISNPTMASTLHISHFIPSITATFLAPMMKEARHFEAALLCGDLDPGDQEQMDARVAEMRLLMMNVGQVMEKIQQM